MDSKFINSSNTTGSDRTNSPHFLGVQMACFIVIAVIATIANLVVFFRIVRRGASRASDILILNLVSSDAAVGVFSIPLDITEKLSNRWPFGGPMCKAVYPLQTALMSVTVLTLLFMSLERYRAIATPFKHSPSGRKKISVVIGIWIFSIIIATPYATILRFDGEFCSELWPADSSSKIYTIAMFVILYLTPLSVITFVYSAIGRFLHKHTKNIKKINSINQVKNLSRKKYNRNVRIAKVFVAGVVVFAICQLPTHVIWLWFELGNGGQWTHFNDVKVLCNVLTYLNSAIDPFIFGSLDTSCFSCIKQYGWQMVSLQRCSSSGYSGERDQILASSFNRHRRMNALRHKKDSKQESSESKV